MHGFGTKYIQDLKRLIKKLREPIGNNGHGLQSKEVLILPSDVKFDPGVQKSFLKSCAFNQFVLLPEKI